MVFSSCICAAFDKLEQRFTTAPVLRHFNPTLPIHVHMDASSFAISGTLSQLDPDDSQWHPVAFFSRKCIPAQCNYGTPDLEMLSIVESVQHWCHYLEGTRHTVQILSDQKNLTTFMSTKVLNCWQAGWAELLADYDFFSCSYPRQREPARWPIPSPQLQSPPREIDQNQNTPFHDFWVTHFNPPLLHDGEHSTHVRKREPPL